MVGFKSKTYHLPEKLVSLRFTPFYVEDASGQNSTLTLDISQYVDVTNVEYSLDNENWSSIQPTIPANGRVYIRANATRWSFTSSPYDPIISSNNNFNVGGNIMSLLYGSDFTGNENTFPEGSAQTFMALFRHSTGIISASNLILPATTLVNACYEFLFGECSNLVDIPALPATTLAEYCYQGMFRGCSSITTAPVLPATTLTNTCYSGMFYGCTGLTTAPELPATTLAKRCYNAMFNGCTGLTTAPELPATTLAESCYYWMFRNCSSLNSIKCLAEDMSANDCLYNWVSGVSATGTFYQSENADWPDGNSGIPDDWTVIIV